MISEGRSLFTGVFNFIYDLFVFDCCGSCWVNLSVLVIFSKAFDVFWDCLLFSSAFIEEWGYDFRSWFLPFLLFVNYCIFVCSQSVCLNYAYITIWASLLLRSRMLATLMSISRNCPRFNALSFLWSVLVALIKLTSSWWGLNSN